MKRSRRVQVVAMVKSLFRLREHTSADSETTMNLAIGHNYQDDLLHTIECAQRVGCHTMFLNCNVPHDIHKPWVRDIIASCKNFYFIVRMPIYYLGTPEPTDSHVMGYICAGSNDLRSR